MATAPVYSSALIQALRSAPSDSVGVPSGVVLLPNSQDIGLPINFVRSPRTGLAFDPPVLRLPTVAPPPRTAPPTSPPRRTEGTNPPPPVVRKPVVRVDTPVVVDDPVVDNPVVDDPVVDDPVAVTSPVTDTPPLLIEDLLPLLPEEEKKPNVTVNEVDVTDTPAPPTDAADDFEVDRELGIVQQSDVFGGPIVSAPITTTTTRTPSVTVNEVGLSDTVAPPTDPADDFEIDRELGLVQQSDMFMGPTAQVDAAAPSQTNDRLISNVGNVTVADIEDFSDYADLLNTDITSTLPAAVAAPSSYDQLTDQELMELALFDMMAQEALTRRAPVPFNTTQRA